MMKNVVRGFIKNTLLKKNRKQNYRMFDGYFRKIINNGVSGIVVDSDFKKQWIQKWSVFGDSPNPDCYDAFSKYFGNSVDIVPNEIGRNFIEPILTPSQYQPFYNDKNSFDLIFPQEWLPKTFVRSMMGHLYKGDYSSLTEEDFYSIIGQHEKIVVKPALYMGGAGVSLFERKDDKLVDHCGQELTLKYLKDKYKTNFLLQECLSEHPYLAQFNRSSINTIRMATYRDVKTGEVVVLGAVLRMGGNGSFVDNACSGGSFIRILDDGKLDKYTCNEHGKISAVHNGVDFSKSEYVIPNYDQIKKFAKNIAQRLPHMSLFANDIIIDENGIPKLIEVNTKMFSYWLYQFYDKPIFGDRLDDLMSYCKKENEKVTVCIDQKYM